jgi:hypothetical protein
VIAVYGKVVEVRHRVVEAVAASHPADLFNVPR